MTSHCTSLQLCCVCEQTNKEMEDKEASASVFSFASASGEARKPKEIFCQPCDEDREDDSDDDTAKIRPCDRIVQPSDAIDIQKSDEIIFVLGTRTQKVTCIGGLDDMPNLRVSWCSCFLFLETLRLQACFCRNSL